MDLMLSCYLKFSQALTSRVTRASLAAKSIATAAQANMLRNISVVRAIQDDLTEDGLHDFFEGVSVFEFEPCTLIMGLAAVDGSRIYIGRRHLMIEGDTFAQRPMENAYAHCLSLWNNHDPFRIVSCHNRNLRSMEGPDIKVEAGDFYEDRVHGPVRAAPSPFRIDGHSGIRTF